MFEHKFPLFFGIIDKDCIQNARPKADTTLNIFPENLFHDVRRKERKGDKVHKHERKLQS